MASFSYLVKEELISLEELNKKEFLEGIFQVNAGINLSSTGLSLEYKTKNENIALKIKEIIKDLYKVDSVITSYREVRLNKDMVYLLTINQNANFIIRDLKLMQAKGDTGYSLKKDIVDEEKRISYLKGSFLSTGSVNDPQTFTYHLEIQAFNTIVASNIKDLLNSFDLNAKVSQNRRGYIVYLKSAEKISDFIRIIGASEALLHFENLRIEKDLSNSINRVINCEVANQKKVEEASKRQLLEIEKVLEYYKDNIPKSAMEALILRKENPEDSLQELSDKSEERFGYYISRSALNHRLKAIHDLYTSIPNKEA